MTAFDVEALIAQLETLGEQTLQEVAHHPVMAAWFAGRPDRERVFAFQAQLYYQVAATIPLLERCARTCERLAANDPMYAVLARHYAHHALEESEPVPHEILLLDGLRQQGFCVDPLPPPGRAVQEYIDRGFWAAEHAPIHELGRAAVLERVGGRLAQRVPRAAASAPAGTADFYGVHATADSSRGGHVDENARILRELSVFATFVARAHEVLAGGEHAREYMRGLLAYVDAQP
ncbi:MAG TPA: hypothetical protein VK066_32385 [Chloroflexota bacterium]|nr:hypothetical protein [Chloroflexota bacterium]